jgi:hypothetical protein
METDPREITEAQTQLILKLLPDIRGYYREFGRGIPVIKPNPQDTDVEEMGYVPLGKWNQHLMSISPELAGDAYTRHRVATYDVRFEVLVLMIVSGGIALVSLPLSFVDGLNAGLALDSYQPPQPPQPPERGRRRKK